MALPLLTGMPSWLLHPIVPVALITVGSHLPHVSRPDLPCFFCSQDSPTPATWLRVEVAGGTG